MIPFASDAREKLIRGVPALGGVPCAAAASAQAGIID
jgi:hypothetical protein